MSSYILFKDIPDLQIGDIIYECESGCNIKIRIETIPEEYREGYQWLATNEYNGEIIYYFTMNSAYACKLYRQPEYVMIKDGMICQPFLGQKPEDYEWIKIAR